MCCTTSKKYRYNTGQEIGFPVLRSRLNLFPKTKIMKENILMKTSNSQKGFTLVELAVVMIIIGLLIGGILKGQELINNAQVASTVTQIKGIDAAASTFKDMYNAVAGDITNPEDRIPNCTDDCDSAGDGNSIVGTDDDFGNAPTGERLAYFSQLAAADLLSGIDIVAGVDAWGVRYPSTSVGGGFHIGYNSDGADLDNYLGSTGRGGHYLALHATADGGVNGTGVINPTTAARIDRKLDDGNPLAGSVLAAGASDCIDSDIYKEADDIVSCNLYIRIQQ